MTNQQPRTMLFLHGAHPEETIPWSPGLTFGQALGGAGKTVPAGATLLADGNQVTTNAKIPDGVERIEVMETAWVLG